VIFITQFEKYMYIYMYNSKLVERRWNGQKKTFEVLVHPTCARRLKVDHVAAFPSVSQSASDVLVELDKLR
jgi:hypothetical protein